MNKKSIKLFDLVSSHRTELMGLATLWVFVLHKWVPKFSTGSLSKIENNIKYAGVCGVEIFLFLSGMGLVFAYEKKESIKQFYFDRFKRIFIPYFARTFIAYMFRFGFGIDFFKELFWYNFLFVSIWKTIAWYYNAIVVFYLFFPIYYHFFKKTNNKLLFTLTIITIVILAINYGNSFIREDFYNVIDRIPIFIVGILFGYIGKYNNSLNFNSYYIVIAIIMMLNWRYISFGEFDYEYSGYFILSLCVIVLFSFLFEINKSNIIKKIFTILGKNSFEIYMVQFCIDPNRFFNNMPILIANVIYLIVVVLVGICLNQINKYFWLFVENIAKKKTN